MDTATDTNIDSDSSFSEEEQLIPGSKAFIAKVQGQAITELPHDLYIPPDALEVFLETFEGPLDLLLYLIRKQNLNILDIPIAEITRQYVEYVEVMVAVKLELAADYLVMAAILAEIKSRLLLPRVETADDEEEVDPRAELVRRLQEYERFKQAAEDIDSLPRMGRDNYSTIVAIPEINKQLSPPDVELSELLRAFGQVLLRSDLQAAHQIDREVLSVRERMSKVLQRVTDSDSFIEFTSLFTLSEGKGGVIVTFLAILELAKEALIQIVQNEAFGPIYVKAYDS